MDEHMTQDEHTAAALAALGMAERSDPEFKPDYHVQAVTHAVLALAEAVRGRLASTREGE